MNIAVLVTSYDGYSDIWPISAELFKRFWPDRQWPLYWMSNGHPVPLGKAILAPKIPRQRWGYNVAAAVESLSQEFVLFWVEEIFLLSEVPMQMFEQAAELLTKHDDVGIVQLTRYYVQPDTPMIGDFVDYPENEPGFSSALPAIFRKNVLLHLLKTLPQSNDFEQQSAKIMARDFPNTRSLISCRPMFKFCDNALLAGPWRQCAVKHLKDLGLDNIDFNARGISPDPCRFMDGVPA